MLLHGFAFLALRRSTTHSLQKMTELWAADAGGRSQHSAINTDAEHSCWQRATRTYAACHLLCLAHVSLHAACYAAAFSLQQQPHKMAVAVVGAGMPAEHYGGVPPSHERATRLGLLWAPVR